MYIKTDKIPIKTLKEAKRLEYNRWEPLRCPLMGNEEVVFNKDGFYHLTHDGRGKIRKESDQRMRLNLLGDVRKVIYRAREFATEERVISANQNKLGKDIYFYELVYKFSQRKAVSVVLRRVGNGGKLHYYSVRYNKRGIHTLKKAII